jgi:hypothetical protein
LCTVKAQHDNIIASLLIARSAKHHFSDILEDPILLSADIICLTEANFYSGDNMKIDKYNCTQLPMDFLLNSDKNSSFKDVARLRAT